MRKRLPLLLAVAVTTAALILPLTSEFKTKAGPRGPAGGSEPSPWLDSRSGGCRVCAAAAALPMKMEPFYRVYRARCNLGPAGVVWPRGRVRKVDLRLIDLELGGGDPIYDRLYDQSESGDGADIQPNQRVGGFELRRGWRPLRTTVLRLHDLDRLWDAASAELDRAVPDALLASEGLRFRLTAGELEGGDLNAPYEINLGLDGAVELGGCGKPVFSARLDYVENDPALEQALSELVRRTPRTLPWIQTLLRAQTLFDAKYFAGAHEAARKVLAEVPNEPHAVALIYASYTSTRVSMCNRGVAFGCDVLELIQRERESTETTCELERGDSRLLR